MWLLMKSQALFWVKDSLVFVHQLIKIINFVDNRVIKIVPVWTNDKIMTLTKEYD